MHFVFAIRGQKDYLNKTIESLSHYSLKTKINKNYSVSQKNREEYFQLGLQPIQLWSLNFPKEYKNIILNTLLQGNQGKLEINNPKTGQTKDFKRNSFFWLIRKILGLKKIPKDYDKTQKLDGVPLDFVQIIALGLKDDFIRPDGTENL